MLYTLVTWEDEGVEVTTHVALPVEQRVEFRDAARRAFCAAESRGVVTVEPMPRECSDKSHDERDCPSRCDWANYVAWSGGVGPSFREWLGVGELPTRESLGAQ
jgi:hypothetical protein